MNLRKLSNQQVLSGAKSFAENERRNTNGLLHHLIEIEARKLYLSVGYPSLFEYVTQELKYSEASAQRRIDAARLLKQVPVLEEKLVSGDLTLGSVGKAQQFFRAERKQGNTFSSDEKKEIVLSLSGLSTVKAEEKLAEKNPEAFRQQRIRPVGKGDLAITFTADEALQQKLKKVRELHSHIDPNMDCAELLSMLAEFYIQKKDPLKKKEKATAPKKVVTSLPLRKHSKSRRAIPAAIANFVRKRDQNRCVWKLPNGKPCNSTWKVQLDHIHPYAMGGPNTVENLRCLCANHNLSRTLKSAGDEGGRASTMRAQHNAYSAIQAFGEREDRARTL